ncbi:MAG: tetratricopeptide repeat protein [Deltaproteobacteria bacterium]|nr:tetratricopeptide repeat protein [Deltaproteobacteria bacterium]
MATFRCSFLLLLAASACHSPRPVAPGPLPRAAYAHYLAGKVALYTDDTDGAIRELQAARAAAPEQPMVSIELAKALVKAKRLPDAQQVLAATRHDWPEHPEVALAWAQVLEKRRDAAAAGAYRRAIELSPGDEQAYLGLARVQPAREAEGTLKQLVARVPASVDGHYRLAQKTLDRGDLTGGERELRAVLEHDPDHIDARVELARTLRKQGKLAEAIAQMRSAFDRAGQPLDVAEELFWLLAEADDLQGAIDLLTLLDDDRSDPDALATIARLEIQLGRLDVASQIAKHLDGELGKLVTLAIEVGQRDLPAVERDAQGFTQYADQARSLLYEARLEAGHTAEARALAKPDEVIAVARATDDKQAALALIEPVVRAHPDNVIALNLIGYLLADTKQRLRDADVYLRRARKLSPGDPAVLDSLGWLLYQQGDTKAAAQVLAHAQRFAPLEPEILVHLAAASGRKELLDQAAAMHPSPDLSRRIDDLRKVIR